MRMRMRSQVTGGGHGRVYALQELPPLAVRSTSDRQIFEHNIHFEFGFNLFQNSIWCVSPYMFRKYQSDPAGK